MNQLASGTAELGGICVSYSSGWSRSSWTWNVPPGAGVRPKPQSCHRAARLGFTHVGTATACPRWGKWLVNTHVGPQFGMPRNHRHIGTRQPICRPTQVPGFLRSVRHLGEPDADGHEKIVRAGIGRQCARLDRLGDASGVRKTREPPAPDHGLRTTEPGTSYAGDFACDQRGLAGSKLCGDR